MKQKSNTIIYFDNETQVTMLVWETHREHVHQFVPVKTIPHQIE